MKKVLLLVMMVTSIILGACSPAPKLSETTPTLDSPVSTAKTPVPKKISLEDAPNILNISLLLPSRFEEVDAASEGMSNKDMGLGSYFSEVQLYVSEDPFQMVYGFIAIINSRIEGAVFDRQLEDEAQMKQLITESVLEGAKDEGIEATMPDLEITHPDIGDSAIFGQGDLESSGFYFGFDMLCFRSNKVYVYLYSLSMSADKVSLVPIAEEIERRIGRFSQ